MFIDDFVWLTEIANKLAIKHRVSQDEVEEVFFNSPKFRFVESGHRSGEGGRYLIVFFIHKPDNLALILSARDMDSAERRRHERK